MNRITATQAALDLLAAIEAVHGPVMFHLSGGCCDGTAPMVYRQGDFRLGSHDVQLGTVGAAPFWTGGAQAEAWADTKLAVDAVPGRGAGFSLDNALERHFVLRSPTCAA
jgi:uncharacterized protein (DUF779 family)